MTTCERLTGGMVPVARRERLWTADEAAHLAGCPDCAAEWRLTEAGAELGGRLPGLDPVRISAGLHRRLAAGPEVVPMTSRRPVRWAIGLAVAAALLLAVGFVSRRRAPGAGAVGPTVGVLNELDGLTGQELATVLEVLEAERPAPAVEGAGLGDLTRDELEQLLRSLEG